MFKSGFARKLRATQGTSEVSTYPKCGWTRSAFARISSASGKTIASPWSFPKPVKRGSASPPPGAGGYESMSSFERSVNSQPGTPLNCGSSGRATALPNRALHLQLDQAVHLDRVLHRELLDDRLDEAVDDQLRGLFLVDAVRLQVEELLLTDLRHGRLVADVDVVLADADRRVGVRAAGGVEQQRVAHHLRLRAMG